MSSVKLAIALDHELDRIASLIGGRLDELLGGIDLFTVDGNDAIARLPASRGGRRTRANAPM